MDHQAERGRVARALQDGRIRLQCCPSARCGLLRISDELSKRRGQQSRCGFFFHLRRTARSLRDGSTRWSCNTSVQPSTAFVTEEQGTRWPQKSCDLLSPKTRLLESLSCATVREASTPHVRAVETFTPSTATMRRRRSSTSGCRGYGAQVATLGQRHMRGTHLTPVAVC